MVPRDRPVHPRRHAGPARAIPLRLALVASALLATLATGCSTPEGTAPIRDTPDDPAVLNVPGVYDRGDAYVTAVGILIRVEDLEGGYWALVDTAEDPLSSRIPPIVAIISNAEETGLADHLGRVLAVRADVPSTTGYGGASELRVDTFAVLGPETSAIRVPREEALSSPGLYCDTTGLLLAVGERTFYDIDMVGERVWALRYPQGSPRQMGIAYVAVLAVSGDPELPEGVVAVRGRQVEDTVSSLGIPRIELEEIVLP